MKYGAHGERTVLSAYVVKALGAIVVLASLGLASIFDVPPSMGATHPKYLLALGDSLAAGYEPSFGTAPPPVDHATGIRDEGYPNSYASDLAKTRKLHLIDLACPGETAASMRTTPAQQQCKELYSTEFNMHSQLAAAQSFLSHNVGNVALVTLDIGANDLDGCVSNTSVNISCLEDHLGTVATNLAAIVQALSSSLHRYDPTAHFVAMNYYDPYLGLAVSDSGSQGSELASASLAATDVFNRELDAAYTRYHVKIANVASAFRVDATLPLVQFEGKQLPTNVVVTCNLTWMCPLAPDTSPNIHPNVAGYHTIASAFEKVLPRP